MANSNDEAARVYDLMEKLLHPEQYAARMKAREEMAKGFLKRVDRWTLEFYIRSATPPQDAD